MTERFVNLTANTKLYNLSNYVPSEENLVLKDGLKIFVFLRINVNENFF